jgi:squalene-hopene/tetraprenyl-beta-curcumene cyclase
MMSLSTFLTSARCPAVLCGVFVVATVSGPLMAQPKPQYELGELKVAAARADEPMLSEFSVDKALEHLEQGTKAWSSARNCISCHTNGTYMQIRPALTAHFGPPATAQRDFYLSQLKSLKAIEPKELKKGTRSAQVIYLAAGLAEWDAHVAKSLSPETSDALALMLDIQLASGTWGTLDCWPPFESDAYHEATVAAMAIGTAPGWLADLKDEKQKAAVQKLKDYLVNTPPLHDYSRVLLLWASTRMTDLVSPEQKAKLAEVLWSHQRPDGGWSIRSFAAPESWGGGNRAKKLRDEPDFSNPASDGHQTGLAVLVLRATGVDAKDLRLQRGIEWLKKNQRESGRWWTRSLNTDSWHYITYSGTAYPLMALAACGEIPAKQ